MTQPTLNRASISCPSGEWNDDDYGVLCDGVVVGRIMKAAAVPVGMSWMWTLTFGHHEDREKLAAGVVLRSGGRSAFRAQTGKHVLILNLTAFDPSESFGSIHTTCL